ncbi:MAG: bifunctional riboflavin kinase/FAD synthetase [Bacteroidales bacterium]
MIIHRGYDSFKAKNPVITLGIFDGVHAGHRMLIDILKRKARQLDGESVIFTFDPHPRQVLSKDDKKLRFLTGPEEKTVLLGRCGVDHLVIIPFDEEFSRMDACEFMENVLVAKAGARYLITGYNHHFGKGGEGDYETVRSCAEKHGLTVEKVAPVLVDDIPVSSTSIREALMSGNLDLANRLLGYRYFIQGSIVSGKKIGRELGFPTANVNPGFKSKLIPRNGVYAVFATVDNVRYPAVMSIGLNPTVTSENTDPVIEVHILGFDRDIYGLGISVELCARLRDEIRFGSLPELSHQIELDRKKASEILSRL